MKRLHVIFASLILVSVVIVSLFFYDIAYIDNVIHSLQLNDKQTVALSICVAVKDEIDIIEWINHHISIGFEKIYLYDNGSIPPLSGCLQKYINQGIVEYQYAPFFFYRYIATLFFSKVRNSSMRIYERCLMKAKYHNHQWMAFIDADEYITFNKSIKPFSTLLSTLQPYDNYGGVVIHWLLYGSSGHIDRPTGGVIKNYQICAPTCHYKTIVNVRYVKSISDNNVHWFYYENGYFAVNELGKKMNPGDYDAPTNTIFSINHYATRSLADMLLKIKRGTGTSKRNMDYFHMVEDLPTMSRNCSLSMSYLYTESNSNDNNKYNINIIESNDTSYYYKDNNNYHNILINGNSICLNGKIVIERN